MGHRGTRRGSIVRIGLRRSRRRAFSMVEVIISIVLVGVAMLPIFTTLGSANRGTVDLENEALAVGLATEAIERARAIGFRGWCRALEDGGRGLRLPVVPQVDRSHGRLSFLETKVTPFKSDDPAVEVDYPEASIPFSRELVMTTVTDTANQILAVRTVATVRWKLNVAGSPERHVTMELVLHGAYP